MLAASFLEMVPKSLELFAASPAFILGGYLVVHLFEHGFAPHFHFGEEVHTEELLDPRVGMSALIGLLSHTFFEGLSALGIILSYQLGIILFMLLSCTSCPRDSPWPRS